MENSKAYKYLIEQVNATDSKKLDGYYPKILEEIYDWERDEVEDIIWNIFHRNNDTDLAEFLPKLKKYNGIEALKEALRTCNIPSGNSLNIANTLLEYTGDEQYLEIFKKNIDASEEDDNLEAVAMLSYCKPSDAIFNILAEIYINDDNETVRSTAVDGLLHCKGYIENPLDMQEIMKTLKISRLFLIDDMEERKKMIEKLENGDLELKK